MPKNTGGYLLPGVIDPEKVSLCISIPNDPEHIAAFWGALTELTMWWNWQRDTEKTALAASLVWEDVVQQARINFELGECASEVQCQTYRTRSPRLTWGPENPFSPDADVPEGYIFHPFTVVTTSIIDSIISVWGLGYEVGDVYTDITKLPPGDWGELIEEGYLFFPHFRVNDLSGAGTVKLHLLNIPQGGRALIIKDGVFDVFNLQLVELNKDIVSIPQETQVPIIVEVEFDDIAEHYLDVVFVPNVNDEVIPFFFGGGIRKIEICGFGLEGCGDMDPCCPEELELLDAIKVLNQTIVNNQITIIENDTTIINQNTDEILNSYTNTYNNWVTTNQSVAIYNQQLYDGNPQSISPNLGENFDDTSEAALCSAIKRYIENDIANYTANVNLAAAAAGLISTAAAALIIGITAGAAAPLVGAWGMILGAATTASVTAWNNAASSPEAKRKTACCMFDSLNGTAITQAAFAASVGDCEFDPTTSEGRVSGRINDANQSQENYLAFLRMLGQEVGTSASECACDCDNAAEIVTTGVYGNVVTNMGNCIWRSVQLTPIEEPAGSGIMRYYHEWKDLLDRCILVEHVPVESEYDTVATSDYFQIDCDDEEQTGVGGGGGQVKKMGFRMGSSPQYYKITLVE